MPKARKRAVSNKSQATKEDVAEKLNAAMSGDVEDYRSRLQQAWAKATALEEAISKFFSPGEGYHNADVLRASVEHQKFASYLAELDALRGVANLVLAYKAQVERLAQAGQELRDLPISAVGGAVIDPKAAEYIAGVSQSKDAVWADLLQQVERWRTISHAVHSVAPPPETD